MTRAVDGTYELPTNSVSPAVASTTIDPDDFNTVMTDLETAVSDTVYTSAGLGSTDNRLPRTDGTNGKVLQGSAIAVDDSGNMSGMGYIDIGEIAAPGSPASNTARLYCVDSAGTTKLAYKDAAGTITTIETSAGGSGSPSVAQGRLTLTTATPVLTSTVSAATTIYYTPYTGRYVPLYSGSSWVMTDIGGELSQATTDTTKSPAACTTNSNYDLFVWDDSGTYRCTRGPAWSSDTARGTGAGTTELERVNGIYVNKIAITNGPAAQRGTYVGTIRTNGSAAVDWLLNTSGAGGSESKLHMWNAYNRVAVATTVNDTTDSWTSTNSAYEALNAGVGSGAGNRISVVRGLDEDEVMVDLRMPAAHSVGANGGVGIGLNSSSANAAQSVCSVTLSASFIIPPSAVYAAAPGIGYHYFQALQRPAASGTTTFYGDVGLSFFKSGIQAHIRA